jgi:glycosyltransferase involved in cell wall biosynthesis
MWRKKLKKTGKPMAKRVMLVVDSKLTFSEAPPSRALYIARSLKKLNFEVEVLGRKGEDITGLKTLQVSGAKHVARLKSLLYIYAKALGNPCIVIVRGEILAFFLLPLRLFGIKLILDFHGWLYREIKVFYEKTMYNKLKAVLFYIMEGICISGSDTVICVSEGIRESLGQEDAAKSIVLENGIDLNESQKVIDLVGKKREEVYSKYDIAKGNSLVGFLGNWERQLDMETMFRGADLAKVNIVVVGEGPKLEEYKEKWKNARFLGELPRFEALKVICLCDATIVPYKKTYAAASFWSQRKVKDYLSLGKPILMSNVKEREKYLQPNKNVLLYEAENAEDLAKKIRALVADKNLIEEMRLHNLKLATSFDWQVLVEQSGLIERILS